MAVSSPTSSCSSSYSSPFFSTSFSSLPVMALREKIIEKILENRVTLIVGETGCGKSSQVPQFLLEENMAPILCTQPRRFAVRAVAKMVAKCRNCELGGEVGYHIGHSKQLSARSKIVFKTAGVLLDEMRDKGLNALKYKVIILDEVHERSVESDLVLVCVKQFLMKNNDLRVVLMSATADLSRYRDYFGNLGRGERVEVLAIPTSNQKTIFQKRVSYLEQVTELLGTSSELSTYCPGPSPSVADTEINSEVQELIRDLILHIHKNEPDIEKSILVFLPTYYSLEQQWYRLVRFRTCFKVHILHSSVDTEKALTTMTICKSHRKIILATNIAESSVTIPKVAYVIDSCRSLQVYWDATRKRDSAELVWVSKSQAEQRRGRTGRTCDGQVYRLVTNSFFGKLEEFESPALLKLSLRQQVLHICCMESRAINDPKALMQKALDPPDSEVTEDALNVLFRMKALQKTPRGRYEPTFYGRLLASFSLSFDASILVVKFGEIGMLREGILLGVLMDTQPLPILHPFGEEQLFLEYVDCYFGGDSSKTILASRKEAVLMANFCAFQFWQRVFKDKRRLEHLKQLLTADENKAVSLMLPKIEQEWCSFHNIIQPSLNHVSEMYEDILNSVHRFRPKFLSLSDGLPTSYNTYEFEHTCYLECQPCDDDTVPHPEDEVNARKCISVPFVAPSQFQTDSIAENLANILKEIRVQYSEDTSDNQHSAIENDDSVDNGEAPICVYFARGFCNRSSNCMFSHSLQAKRPICKFFSSLQGCRNGDSCFFSHDLQKPSSLSSSYHQTTPCVPEDYDPHSTSILHLFPTPSEGCILLLDDTDMHFTSHLASRYEPQQIISTSSLSETFVCDSSLTGVRIFWGLNHPFQTIISRPGCQNPVPWNKVKCVLWFLNPDNYTENTDRQKILVQNFFEYLAIRVLGAAICEMQVVLTMNNIKFSHMQVEKLGRDCFFFLTESFPHDAATFGEFSDAFSMNKPMQVSRPISYVFNLHPPTDVQLGDYASVLHKALHPS